MPSDLVRAALEGARFDVHANADHDEWLAFRRGGIGGSDVAAIFGASRWSTPFTVWQDKLGLSNDDGNGNESMEWGTRNEGNIRDKFAETHPELEVGRMVDDEGRELTLVDRDRPHAHANIDGLLRDGSGRFGVLECKNVDKDMRRFWDDGVPDYYMYQVTHYHGVTGWSFAWVAVLFGGNRYAEYYVERDEDDVVTVEAGVDEFWNTFVVPQVPPMVTGSPVDTDALSGQYHGGDGALPMDAELMRRIDGYASAYQEASEREKAAKADKDAAGNLLRAALGNHESAETDVYRVTWRPSVTRRIDAKALRRAHPDIADEFTTETEGRRLLVRQGDQ